MTPTQRLLDAYAASVRDAVLLKQFTGQIDDASDYVVVLADLGSSQGRDVVQAILDLAKSKAEVLDLPDTADVATLFTQTERERHVAVLAKRADLPPVDRGLRKSGSRGLAILTATDEGIGRVTEGDPIRTGVRMAKHANETR